MSLNRRNALHSSLRKSSPSVVFHCVYFYNRRLLDCPWYYRYVVPKAYEYFIKLTMAAWHVQAATHVKAELTQASRRGLRISKVNYPESWGHETQNGQAANCLWSLNGLFIKGFSSICIFSPFLKSVLSLKRVLGNVGALWSLWIWNCTLFPFTTPTFR